MRLYLVRLVISLLPPTALIRWPCMPALLEIGCIHVSQHLYTLRWLCGACDLFRPAFADQPLGLAFLFCINPMWQHLKYAYVFKALPAAVWWLPGTPVMGQSAGDSFSEYLMVLINRKNTGLSTLLVCSTRGVWEKKQKEGKHKILKPTITLVWEEEGHSDVA